MEVSAFPVLAGQDTLIACWRAESATSPNATVVESARDVIAMFPAFAPMNNAIVLRSDDDNLPEDAARIESAYTAAGVMSWALWIPSRAATFEAEDAVYEVGDLKRDMTTLVMKRTIGATHRFDHAARPAFVSDANRAGDEPTPSDGLGEPEADTNLAAWVMVEGDVAVAGATRFLHGSDCGIYAVGTVPTWRRRGIGRRLVEHLLADAARLGARTATLQSTVAGQRLYESLGFVSVGRYEEWIPA